MSEVILFTSGKGGTGKTSICANIGASLALKGMKTVIVDMNQGLRGLDIVLGTGNLIVYNIFDALNGRCRLSQVLVKHPKIEGLSILPASQIHRQSDVDQEKLTGVLKELKKHFDYVLIDGCSGLDLGFENSRLLYDRCVIICTGDVLSVRSADKVKEVCKRETLTKIQVILNRYRPVLVDQGDMISIEEIEEILGLETLGIVPEDQELYVSSNNGEIPEKGKCEAANAIERISSRIMGMDVERPVFVAPRKSRFWSLFRKDNK